VSHPKLARAGGRAGGVTQGRGGKAHGEPLRATEGVTWPGWLGAIRVGPLYAGSNASKGRSAWRGFAVAAMKPHEPQDWKPGATSGQGRGGGNRQSGGRPQRRHTRRVGDLSPKRSRRRARGMWTPRLARQWRGDLWKLERDIVRPAKGAASRATARQARHGGTHGAIRRSGRHDDDDDERGASRSRRA
jgi:hypothetical protein